MSEKRFISDAKGRNMQRLAEQYSDIDCMSVEEVSDMLSEREIVEQDMVAVGFEIRRELSFVL